MLPRSVAENVADNLIQNALTKRLSEPGIRIRVTLDCDELLVFKVSDSGSAVPPELE
jgi:signal transduction histidine kinase